MGLNIETIFLSLRSPARVSPINHSVSASLGSILKLAFELLHCMSDIIFISRQFCGKLVVGQGDIAS
jgi:hypothetical protein